MWHLYTITVIGRLACAARALWLAWLALRAPSIYAAANGWRVPSGHSELAASKRNGSSAVGPRRKTERLSVCVPVYFLLPYARPQF